MGEDGLAVERLCQGLEKVFGAPAVVETAARPVGSDFIRREVNQSSYLPRSIGDGVLKWASVSAAIGVGRYNPM